MDYSQAAGLIYTEVATWGRTAIRYVPKLAVAILVLFLFTFLSRWFSRLVVRGFDRFSDNHSVINLTGAVIRVLIMALGLFIALSILQLDKAVTSLLAGAGVIALAVGFAFQDLTANFISGTMIAIARPIRVGDVVETNGYTGKVLDIKLRSIVIDNGQGQTIEIPSKDVFQKPVINYSKTGQRRLEISYGISYADDLNRAQQIATQAIQALPFVRTDKAVEVHYRSFTLDNVQGFVWFWLDQTKAGPPDATSEAIKALKTAFDQNDILMMFPPHTYDLKKRKREEQGGPN
ncbi:mechanosensitive ion channel family protein [Spirosoma utsteinense]|uniref:Small conductance mechanosensitive channel n=1 Tax=Spirosoma utsteinense TaxID=2585773 RepID=A0ABR6W7G0_9BACT|nr:mechanosensitive ion channel family protein [Spirosoma utsteinense]MBC3786295.1 small conductance mechanosensitive channel [Spirosoma utsteinense]MBC3791921.1 small conductance mechanosensitive channel [Spirosoma utsteinense]